MKPLAASLRRPLHLGCFALSLALAGCGGGPLTTATGGALALIGHVHGGIQPISGATIQLFAVGTGGNGSQATSLLANPVVTDSHSDFSLTGDYHCPSAGTQVYLVARGGNPGYTSPVDNHALVLLSALGSCGDLVANPNRYISVNEVSTVAAVYALAPFLGGYDHIGASATNSAGIANAFLDAQLLADPATGMVPQLPANLSVEAGKLYALADVIVPCVNSDGGVACTPLFTASTVNGVAPTDVLGALLNIVRHPGSHVAELFDVISSTPPYPTPLTAAPNDWTMSLSVSGGGLAEPTALAVDRFGNVWVTNFGATEPAGLAAFSPQGTPFPGAPFGAGLQTDSYGLALDRNGDVWVTSYDNVQGAGTGSVAKFQGAGSASPGALVAQFTDSSLNWPESIATDPAGAGSVLVGNYLGGTVTKYDLSGHVTQVLGSNLARSQRPVFPVSLTSDNAGGAWLGDQGDNNIVHLLADGTALHVACCDAAQTVQLDLQGNVWATNYYPVGSGSTYTFSEVAPNGSILLNQMSGGGVYAPGGAAVDAGGQFWILNYNGAAGAPVDSFSEIAGNDTGVPAGTPLSPSTGLGFDAQMNWAYSVAPDASGNLWMTVRNGNSLRMFFGMATPTATPATPIPQAP